MKKNNKFNVEVLKVAFDVVVKAVKAIVVTVVQIGLFLVGVTILSAGIVKIMETAVKIVGRQTVSIVAGYGIIGSGVLLALLLVGSVLVDNYNKQ